MQNSQINRLIKLVKRTGEKAVIMDNESDSILMLMDLDAYEKMLNNSGGVEKLTEEELMEKINRDVAVWRAYNDAYNDKERAETMADEEVPEKKPIPKAHNFAEAPRYEAPRLATGARGVSPVQEENATVSPEESASDIVAEEEEEKFYLEPVE